MKKQLFVLFLCATSLPLCARPSTVTMVTNFPGNNNLSYPVVHIEKLDVLPPAGGEGATLSVGDRQGKKVALCVGSLSGQMDGNKLQIDCRPRETNITTVSGEVIMQSGTTLQTGSVTVGTDGSTAESRAEFGDLKVTGMPSEKVGVGAETLQLTNAADLEVFPGLMTGGANIFENCSDGAYWGRKTGDTSGPVFLICGSNSGTIRLTWKEQKTCSITDVRVDEAIGLSCSQAAAVLPLVENVPSGACRQMPGADNFIATKSGSTLTIYSCKE